MAPKNKDEYTLPDEEAGSEEFFAEPEAGGEGGAPLGGKALPPRPPLPKIFGKRLLIPVGLVVVIVIVAHFIGIGGKKTKRAVVKPTQVAQVQSTSAQSLRQEFHVVWQQSNKNQADIKQLQQGMQQLHQQQTQLANGFSQLSSNVQQLAVHLQQVLARLKKPKKKLVKKRRKPRKLAIYYVKAVVPGRAWLQSSVGPTITISVGDKLPGYGRVRMIDSQTGQVKMSGGKVIKYGYYDY